MASFNYEYHNGCLERKCPCRLWVNCLHYIDRNKQSQRLKTKDLENHYEQYHDWYSDNFKISFQMGESISNG